MDFLLPIQAAVRPLDLEIVRSLYNGQNSYVWGMINVKDDEVAKLKTITAFSATEITVYKKVLKRLSLLPQHHDTTLKLAVFVRDSEEKYTASKAESLIQRLLEEMWLYKT